MHKRQESIIDQKTKKIIEKVTISDDNPETLKTVVKINKPEVFKVAGLGEEDVPMTAANLLRLLPQTENMSLENIESRMTSVSLKDEKRLVAGASLTIVLS